MHDRKARSVENLGEGVQVDLQGVDQAHAVAVRDLDHRDVREIGAFAVELRVDGVAGRVAEASHELREVAIALDEVEGLSHPTP